MLNKMPDANLDRTELDRTCALGLELGHAVAAVHLRKPCDDLNHVRLA